MSSHTGSPLSHTSRLPAVPAPPSTLGGGTHRPGPPGLEDPVVELRRVMGILFGVDNGGGAIGEVKRGVDAWVEAW